MEILSVVPRSGTQFTARPFPEVLATPRLLEESLAKRWCRASLEFFSWKGGCACRRALKLALRMRTFSAGLKKGKMKAIITILLLGTSVALSAIDPSGAFDWTWRAPFAGSVLISGEEGVTLTARGEYYFGSRGKIVTPERGLLPRPDTEATIRDVAEGNGTIIAVGDGGLIWREDPGKRWLPVASGTLKNLSSAVYAQGKWVIAGDNIVLFSTDLTNFTSITFPAGFPQFSLRKTIYALGRYFIFGTENPGTVNARGFIAASEDGINWQRPQLPDVGPLVDAVPGEALIVAVSSDGSIISSNTGAGWNIRWKAEDGMNVQFVGVAWGGGKYVALGHDGFALTSSGGDSWTSLGSGPDHHPLFSFFDRYFDITFSSNPNEFHTYVRGQGLRKSFFQTPVSGIGHRGGGARALHSGLAAVGTQYFFVRHFLDSWAVPGTSVISFQPLSINKIGNDVMVHSPGMQSFHSQGFSSELGPAFLSERILGGNGAFVAVTRAGEIFYSTNMYDVNSWSLAFSVPNAQFTAASFGNDRFVVIGNLMGEEGPLEGIIYSSQNGREWTESLRSETIIRDVAFGTGIFTAVGNTSSAGVSLVSSDGVDWKRSSPLPNLPFDNIASGLGIFVASAFSDRPEIFTSNDGLIWKEQPFSMDNHVVEIAFTGYTFVGLGADGEVLESNHILVGIRPQSTGIRLDVTSTYPQLIIETSSDLQEWSLFVNETNRFRVGLPNPVITSVSVTGYYDSGADEHRFYRARRPE
jgi:hypothetical protein